MNCLVLFHNTENTEGGRRNWGKTKTNLHIKKEKKFNEILSPILSFKKFKRSFISFL